MYSSQRLRILVERQSWLDGKSETCTQSSGVVTTAVRIRPGGVAPVCPFPAAVRFESNASPSIKSSSTVLRKGRRWTGYAAKILSKRYADAFPRLIGVWTTAGAGFPLRQRGTGRLQAEQKARPKLASIQWRCIWEVYFMHRCDPFAVACRSKPRPNRWEAIERNSSALRRMRRIGTITRQAIADV